MIIFITIGRVITTENKNCANLIQNACETSQRKNNTKETKETLSNSSLDQQSNKNKRSSNHLKHRSDSKKEINPNINNNNSKIRNSYRHHISRNSETNAEKSKESINSSSDTEIEESQKTSRQQKRKNRAKRSRKKCSQSSESDAPDASSEEIGPQPPQTPDSVRGSDENIFSPEVDFDQSLIDVNKVKDSDSKCSNNNTNEDNFDDSNKVIDSESKSDLVQVSVSALTSTATVISSVKCAETSQSSTTSSSESTISTTKTNNIPVISNLLVKSETISSQAVKSNQLSIEQKDKNPNKVDCNAPQMVPIMCSLDEQLNTSKPNDSKGLPHNDINSEKKIDVNNKSPNLKSASISSVKTDSCSNKTISELNDLKSSNLSLALDRHESVTVYRDPNLANKQIIRHIESLQHLPHGLMHSVTSTTASSVTNAPEFSRLPPTSQARACQPSILPPASGSSMSQQYKLTTPAIHSHPPPQSHILSAGPHDPQLFRHLMPMVSGFNAPPIDVIWQQKNYPHLSPISSSTTWGAFNEQMRAQILHHESDKQQGIRIERFLIKIFITKHLY